MSLADMLAPELRDNVQSYEPNEESTQPEVPLAGTTYYYQKVQGTHQHLATSM